MAILSFLSVNPDFNFLFIILAAELIILMLLIFALVFVKVRDYYADKREKYAQQTISLLFLETLEKVEDVQPLEVALKPFANDRILLYQVENFERRFKGGEWDKIKKAVSEIFLLPKARKFYSSPTLSQKNFAARAFALCPFQDDLPKILSLLNDDSFLIRAIAASAAIELEDFAAVDKILFFMSQQEGYTHFFYRDLLVNKSSINVLKYIEEVAEKNKDLAIHLCCLEVLSRKSLIITRHFLTKDLHSADEKIRLAAVRLYAHNLQKESPVVLSLCIEDSYPQIRMEAAIGLRHFLSGSALKLLEKALSDKEWEVRLQAGLSLKNMGKLGQQILDNQSPEGNQVAYDTAQYVSHFDW